MSTFAEQLARLRVVVTTGRCPRDLAAWALETIVELTPAAERMAARNALLREAASRVSGSPWARARRLRREVEALGLHPGLRERARDDGVRELVARALEVDPGPISERQILRVIES
jgi:hypothetical protein